MSIAQPEGETGAAPEEDPTLSRDQPIEVPAKPHMPPVVVAFLAERFRTTRCFLEYGAGGSTRMAAASGVPFVFSVESDTAFAQEVERLVTEEAPGTRLTMVAGNLGRTKSWGRPSDTRSCGTWPRYVASVWDDIRTAEESPELILIDGRFRVACFLFSLIQSAPGTTFVFDDYVGRADRYQVVEQILRPARLLSRAALFERPAELDIPRAVSELVLHVTDPR